MGACLGSAPASIDEEHNRLFLGRPRDPVTSAVPCQMYNVIRDADVVMGDNYTSR